MDVVRSSTDTAIDVERVRFRGHSYDVVWLSVQRPIEMYWRDGAGRPYGSLGAVRDAVHQRGRRLLFATNAGMYDSAQAPVGWLVVDRVEQRTLTAPTMPGAAGNYWMLPSNGVFFQTPTAFRVRRTDRLTADDRRVARAATQSGPMLLFGGVVNPQFGPNSQNRNVRSGVGVGRDSTRAVFAISDDHVTFYELTTFLRDALGCRDALYLDGAVSLLYAPSIGRADTTGSFGAILGLSGTRRRR